ncbi:hypothetical protein MAR_014197 [Mya arenaria]|uniref:B box-type domain-containing protein n=1 Tax=Mya arenaria TaxID=6604 RepID=A0ABY7G5P6_MYAAR|nr:hypothetical protein MAR_014197 [Mya arenaria]
MLKNGNMPKDVSPFRAIRDLLKCNTHTENEVAYECVYHKQLICVSCLTGSHRKCDDIVDLGTSDKNCLAKAADFSLITKLLDRLKICTQRNVETADRSLGSVSLQIGDAPIETRVKSPENICNAEGTEANVSGEAGVPPYETIKRKVDSGKMYNKT